MTPALISLLLIALMSAMFRDYLLSSAAILLLVVHLLQIRPVTTALQKYSFDIGIFFLMIFLLFPLASGKFDPMEMTKELLSPAGIMAFLAGLTVSFIGGKGLGILPSQPVILFGVLAGTLVGVLFFRGLPAGLIIAAGIVALCKYFISS
ncbi:DUF441 family protein [Thermoactinomyces mirandus]|uniref:UPF0756 membrane protein H2C83_07300 n=1 Tax=Thermoactinomyces mirandus TaxID=2756294 RepID=A0A7W1XRV0_9BACL|nr:DUF441 family protein [Thermoactinomyces mirandus]MBA4602124.1 DUF441 family protein [Thermoactinomyces mirandus]